MITLLTGYDKEFVDYLTKVVFDLYGVDMKYKEEPCLKQKESKARRMCWYLLHFNYDYSSAVIAQIYNTGQRTIRKGNASTKFLVENIDIYKHEYEEAIKRIEW